MQRSDGAKESAPVDAAVLLRGSLVSVVRLVAVIAVSIEVHRLFGFGARRFREGLRCRNVGPFSAGAHAHLGHSRCGVLEILAERAHDGVLTAIHKAQRHRQVNAYLAKAEKETDEQLMQRRVRMRMRADACSRPPHATPSQPPRYRKKGAWQEQYLPRSTGVPRPSRMQARGSTHLDADRLGPPAVDTKAHVAVARTGAALVCALFLRVDKFVAESGEEAHVARLVNSKNRLVSKQTRPWIGS
jgi:hypothetical protein